MRQQSSLRPAVKGAILSVIGAVIALLKDNESSFTIEEQKIEQSIRILVHVLHFEVFETKKKNELNLIKGALNGIHSCLKSKYNRLIFDNNEYSQKVYKVLVSVICPSDSLNRYDVCKAGLALLADQASELMPLLINDYRNTYNKLYSVCHHKNIDLSKSAYRTLDNFYRAISQYISAWYPNSDALDKPKLRDCFWFFLTSFTDILKKNSTVDPNDPDLPHLHMKIVSLSIRGYGYFASCCNLFITKDEIS
jgi:hypothetical protein